MRIDCHVHISACTPGIPGTPGTPGTPDKPGHGSMSPRLLKSLPFRFMRWHFGIKGYDEAAERHVERLLVEAIGQTPELDAAVTLAFDAAHRPDGSRDDANTHLFVTNDYAAALARKHPKLLFGCSVHPYRKDAVAELERCVAAGAVLCKWLPIVQNFNPADPRCEPFYETLAHHRLPLLSHTGGEQCLPKLDPAVASPVLLEPALRRGVTVIAAHCGTRAKFSEPTFVHEFARMCREHERFYGDTSALNLPARWHAFDVILRDPAVRAKLVHGSDWPVIVLPPPGRVGWGNAWRFMRERNWLRRDVLIKQALGFDEAYWTRAATILRLPAR